MMIMVEVTSWWCEIVLVLDLCVTLCVNDVDYVVSANKNEACGTEERIWKLFS